jgi:hypothetical protein
MFKKTIFTVLSIAFCVGFSMATVAQHSHHNHSRHHSHDHTHHANENMDMDMAHHHEHGPAASDDIPRQVKLVTGQGEFIFSWDEGLTDAFPEDAREFEAGMHGGFTEDPETGIVYIGIPGYGLCSISPDLVKWSTVGTDSRLKDNIHGIGFFVHKGEKYLALAQEGRRVLIITLDGRIMSEIVKPEGTEFTFEQANEFFTSPDSNFGVTDVTYLNGILYVAHGYSNGDFVLTIEENNGVWSWGELAWGGKGDNPGQFQTAHGIYAHEEHIFVANRAAGQVVKFTGEGKFVNTFSNIPDGSLICNLSYKEEHYFLNALHAIGDQKSAPIYVHTDEELVSTIVPGDLDIPDLTNIHQVWPHIVTENGSKQLYLLVHGWNKGKFAVLKMET